MLCSLFLPPFALHGISMELKEIREHLGRVKAAYQRNDTLRALTFAIMGLKGMLPLSQPPSDIRGLARDAVQLLARDEQIKPLCKTPLIYNPGHERQILAALAGAYKALVELQNHEEPAKARARKQKLDQALNLGMRLLAQGQISEADHAFTDAANNYRDEHRLFALIGRALLEAQEPRRALPYLKRGLEAVPDDPLLRDLMDQAQRLKTEAAN